MTKASEQQLTQDGETRSKQATRRSSDSSVIRAILNLLGHPTTTSSDTISLSHANGRDFSPSSHFCTSLSDRVRQGTSLRCTPQGDERVRKPPKGYGRGRVLGLPQGNERVWGPPPRVMGGSGNLPRMTVGSKDLPKGDGRVQVPPYSDGQIRRPPQGHVHGQVRQPLRRPLWAGR